MIIEKNNFFRILFFIFISCNLQQSFASDTLVLSKNAIRTRAISFIPVSKSTQVNGLAIGIIAQPWMKAESLHINGLSVELEPFVLLGLPFLVVMPLFTPFSKEAKLYEDSARVVKTEIHGMSIGILGSSETDKLKGFGLNGVICLTHVVNGVIVTGIMNSHYEFNGVCISALSNVATKGKGVQISLFNACKTGNVIQFGLLNRIGKRTTPFVNFRFKSNKSK